MTSSPLREKEVSLLSGYPDKKYVIGIDEAGRGAVFGPVCVAGLLVPLGMENHPWMEEVDDSKQLPPLRRQELAKILHSTFQARVYFCGRKYIDRFNINVAVKYSVYRICRDILTRFSIPVEQVLVLLDGNYNFDYPVLGMPDEMPEIVPVVRGDALCFSIAGASILAKTSRDERITRSSVHYPGFSLEKNAGYGTPEHLAALEKSGLTRHHRRSFLKNYSPNHGA